MTEIGAGQPLFFYHIPKTGGQALNMSISRFFAPEHRLTEGGHPLGGNLSLDFIKSQPADWLTRIRYIYGHPAAGVGGLLQGKTRTITLLRDPVERVISDYLHVSREPVLSLNEAATGLGLENFLRAFPERFAAQAAWLHMAFEGEKRPRMQQYYRMVPRALDYLESMMLVGTLDGSDEFLSQLALIMGWPVPPRMSPFNQAPESQASATSRQQMREILAKLEREPFYGDLLACDRMVYRHAKELAARFARSTLWHVLFARGPVDDTCPFLVHRSALGDILIGQNFGEVEHDRPGRWSGPAWWTLIARQSQIFVRRLAPEAQLTFTVNGWRGIQPGEVALLHEGRPLKLSIATDETGDGTVQVDLAGVPTGSYQELELELTWGRRRVPKAPFYPGVRCAAFRLEP